MSKGGSSNVTEQIPAQGNAAVQNIMQMVGNRMAGVNDRLAGLNDRFANMNIPQFQNVNLPQLPMMNFPQNMFSRWGQHGVGPANMMGNLPLLQNILSRFQGGNGNNGGNPPPGLLG